MPLALCHSNLAPGGGGLAYLWRERYPLFAILSFFALSCLLVSPLRNVPVIDDWTYAWSVENLIRTGRLAVLDWSAHYPIFQTLWSSPWALLFGFSFGVLRLSMVVLAALGCAALYLTLRELELDRERSLLGALALAANPVFFLLSFSFMTDVPFLSMMNLALLCYLTGLKRDRPVWLWVGGLFAAAAFLSRQIGLAIPLVMLPSLFLKEGGWTKLPKRLAPLLVSLLGMGLLGLWVSKSLGRTSVMTQRMEGIRYLFLVSPGEYLNYNLDLLLQAVFAIFPLLIAGISLKSRRWLLTLAASVIGGAILLWLYFGEVSLPLHGENTWSLEELGCGRALIQGVLMVTGPAHHFSRLARALMLISAAVLVVGIARLLFETRGRMSKPARLMIASGLLHLGTINALWLYYDRYYLVLLPSLIYLALKLTLKTGLSRVLAWSGVAFLSFVSISGTWDALRFNEACREAFDYLRAAGVPAAEIDAGYSLNGWVLYAHPENLPPGAHPTEDVPWVTSQTELPYAISNTPFPGYDILKEVSWRGSLWAVSNRVYALHQQEGQSTRAP